MRMPSLKSCFNIGALSLLMVGTADAAHECRRAIHKAFEADHRRLHHEFDAEKRAIHEEHRASRECVLEEIRHAERELCGQRRAAVIRQLHYELRQLDRRHHHRLRSLHTRLEQQRDALRHERDRALQACRNGCRGACGAQRPHVEPDVSDQYGPAFQQPGRPYRTVRPYSVRNAVESPLQLLLRDLLARQF